MNTGSFLRVVKAVKVFTTPAEVITAVAEANLELQRGEFVCIHGASGSGKSTLLSLICGLDLPDAGELWLGETRIDTLNEDQRARLRRNQIGVVFQHDNLIEEFTVAENVAFVLELQGKAPSAITSDVQAALDVVGLGDLGQRWPHELSGGQQQRVGIARALVGGRQLLIADEPTAALDSINSEALFSLFAELSNSGITVVLASHDPLAHAYATRTMRMVDGVLSDGVE